MKKALILIAALLCSTAHAQYYDGNRLQELSRGDSVERTLVLGFIIGVHDGNTDTICSPRSATTGQIRDVVINWLNEHPEVRHLSAAALVIYRLRELWPCAKGKTEPKERSL